MDTENAGTFEPTLDWSREWLPSAQWVATTFVLTLICLLLVLAALAYRHKGPHPEPYKLSED